MLLLGAAAMPDLLDVVALGETMVLFLAQQAGPLREASTFSRHIAGAESNVAAGMGRRGRGAGFTGRVGDEELGRVILSGLRGEGGDVSQAIFDPGAPPGLVTRERREVGPVAVLYSRRGSAASRL